MTLCFITMMMIPIQQRPQNMNRSQKRKKLIDQVGVLRDTDQHFSIKQTKVVFLCIQYQKKCQLVYISEKLMHKSITTKPTRIQWR